MNMSILYSLIFGSCGLIIGLFAGAITFFVVYRRNILTALMLFIKRSQQALSVESRLTKQLSTQMLDDLLDNAISIGGFPIPLGQICKDKLPGSYEWARKNAAKNPEAFWGAVGKTILPMMMGYAQRAAGKQEKEIMTAAQEHLSPLSQILSMGSNIPIKQHGPERSPAPPALTEGATNATKESAQALQR